MESFSKIIIFLCLFHPAVLSLNQRKLLPVLNPGCNPPNCNTTAKLIYVRADGDNSTLHYLWDFTKKPTFLLSVNDIDSEIIVDWKSFIQYDNRSVTFSSEPYYAFGVILDEIYEFNDENDTGILPSTNKSIITMDTDKFDWEVSSLVDDVSSDSVILTVSANLHNETGNFEIKTYAFGSVGHANVLPHLLHNENTSQIDIIMDGFSTSFENSRFALQLIMFSTDGAQSQMKLSAKKTIDDADTPGVFTIDTLTVDKSKHNYSSKSGISGFVQWKPVVYTFNERDLSNSTQTVQYNVMNVTNPASELNFTLLYALYGTKISNLMVKAENVSFGFKADGFYRKTNFSTWSFVVGVGDPPSSSFPMIIVLVLAIGLGLPVLLVLSGAVYIMYKRLTKRQDELFLTR